MAEEKPPKSEEGAIRILAVSDAVTKTLYHPEAAKVTGRVDLLLGCGDLPYSYLEYLVTTLHAPHAFFVHGNHDAPELCQCGETLEAPGGWHDLNEQSVYVSELDLIVAGLEGSIRYRPGAPFQYTQAEMALKVRGLALRLLINKLRYGRYLDIFIAHSPAEGIHDGSDDAHQGFGAFLALMRRFRPRLFLHGHKHSYGCQTWRTRYATTDIVNVYPFRTLQWHPTRISYGRAYHR